MATLTYLEKKLLEDLFGMGSGYVLDFSDWTYEAFFRDFDVNIEAEAFHKNGRSKAKRMRAFWELAPDKKVGEVVEGLLRYIDATSPMGAVGAVEDKHWTIVHRLCGTQPEAPKAAQTEGEFLAMEFGKLDLTSLALSPAIEVTIKQRLEEIRTCLISKAPLSVVFLSGSTLEGLLLDAAVKNPQAFNTAKAAPRRDGRVRQFPDWTLNELIDVAHETGRISLDVKKYSHALRDFRNYIHPFAQASASFAPDEHTAKISWQVLRAAIADLTGGR